MQAPGPSGRQHHCNRGITHPCTHTVMSSTMLLRSLRAASHQGALRSVSRVPMVSRTPVRTPYSSRFSTSSSSKAALAHDLPAQPTILLDTPSADYIKEEELDVDLIPPEQVKLVITDRAAEVRQTVDPRDGVPTSSTSNYGR
jgi:hypothetical protein